MLAELYTFTGVTRVSDTPKFPMGIFMFFSALLKVSQGCLTLQILAISVLSLSFDTL